MDSNIFLNYLLDEYRGTTGFFSYHAETFFKRTLSCEFSLVISNLVIKEILNKSKTSKENLEKFMKRFIEAGKLEIIKTTDEDTETATKMLNHTSHYTDAIHAAIAKRTRCEYIITRNKKDFATFGLSSKVPEEL